MAQTRRSQKITVLNTTGSPRVLNKAGAFIFPGATKEADPTDPFTADLLAKGYIIIKEG